MVEKAVPVGLIVPFLGIVGTGMASFVPYKIKDQL